MASERDSEQKGQLSERNRLFLEDWQKAREEFKKLPPEEQEKARRAAQELWNRATLNGKID